ncbi:MAG TPA: response regulator [Aggregatilineales bacterium]|nr:response regulator [Aggregatilineales bacterium]
MNAQQPNAASEQKRILIVEDDPRNATLLQAMLRITGIFDMHVCRSGADLMDTVARMAQIDLILLDLQLPGEDGFQIYGRLRNQESLQAVPIVAVTAQVMVDEIARAEKAGFSGFLGKPLNYDRFPGQIRRLLAGERVWEPR